MEDKELERLKEKKLQEMLAASQTPKNTVIDLNDSNFEQEIKQGVTLVDFWAEWCGPCKLMHPVFERMSKKYKEVKFGRVNVDQNQSTAMRFGVQAIPTFIMFKDGVQIDKMMGAVGEPGIHMIIKKHLKDN